MSKQVVTIGYMKEFTNGIVDVIHPSGDTYCPTYSELTGGSVCAVWGNAEKAHESTNGIFVSGYSVGDSRETYASNQLVLRSDVKLRWLSLDSVSANASTHSLDACGDHSDITASASFDEITKSEGGSTSKTATYSDATINYTVSADESWVSVDGSVVSVGMNAQCVNAIRSFNASASYSYSGVSKSGSVSISQAANVCTDYECPEGYEGSGYTMDSCGNKVSEDCTESTGCAFTIVDFPQDVGRSAKMCPGTEYNWEIEYVGEWEVPVWTSDNPSVASIEGTSGRFCLVYAESTGQTNIRVGSSTCSGDVIPLRVYDAPECYSMECSITDHASTMSNIGDTYQWKVNCYGGAQWSSDDTSVATVSSDGLVTAVGYGTTTIHATCNRCSGSDWWDVTVGSVGCSIDTFTFSMEVGDTYQFEASCSDSTSPNPSWSSSDTNVLTVNSNGLVRAVGPGSASIYVTCSCGNDVVSNITVTNPGCTATSTSYTIECGSVSVGASATSASIPYTGIATDNCGAVEREYLTYSATFPQNTASTPTERSFTINYHGQTCVGKVYQAASGCTPQPITYSNCAVVDVSPSTLSWEGGQISVSITATSSDTCSQGAYATSEGVYVSENPSSSPRSVTGTVTSPCGGNLTWGGVTQEGKPAECNITSVTLSDDEVTQDYEGQPVRTLPSVHGTNCSSSDLIWQCGGQTGRSGQDYFMTSASGTYYISASTKPSVYAAFIVNPPSPSYDAIVYLTVNVRNNGGVPIPYVNVGAITASTSLSLSIEGSVNGRAFSIRVENASSQGQDFCGNFDTPIPSFDDIKYGQIENLRYFNVSLSNADIHLSSGSIQDDTPPC